MTDRTVPAESEDKRRAQAARIAELEAEVARLLDLLTTARSFVRYFHDEEATVFLLATAALAAPDTGGADGE